MRRCLKKQNPRLGQTAVEYLLTTMTLLIAFAGIYGWLQIGLRNMFRGAARLILAAYMELP
ncbi:MAG: hypothetical protein HY400_03660 [Elusimicrobia bacterium]|nr:hypothetical protein [Elusimicrobiota bacterium]